MSDPIPLFGYPMPDPHWLAHLPAPLAADALADLLTTAAELLNWIDDEDVDPVRAILALGHELVEAVTDGAENQPVVEFPAGLAAQTAGHIADGADLVEAHRTYDACADEYDTVATLQVEEMRRTARQLLQAARGA